jgi:hypothetical protein
VEGPAADVSDAPDLRLGRTGHENRVMP